MDSRPTRRALGAASLATFGASLLPGGARVGFPERAGEFPPPAPSTNGVASAEPEASARVAAKGPR